MLMGIPQVISPQLLRILMEMGHGDELVIGDGNFPAHSIASTCTPGEVAHCPGCGVVQLLDAILKLMPLDYSVETPVLGMAAPEDQKAPIHKELEKTLETHGYGADRLCYLPRFDFYNRAAKGYAVLASGEGERFANLIIKKGVVNGFE